MCAVYVDGAGVNSAANCVSGEGQRNAVLCEAL